MQEKDILIYGGVVFVLFLALSLLMFFSGWGGYGLVGYGFGGIMGMMLGGGLLVLLGLLALIYFAAKAGAGGASGGKPPLEIAKERYAKGEITKKEFEEIKKELAG